MIETFIDILLYAGIVQGFFLALLLRRADGPARRSNNILSVLLIVLSLSVVHSLFIGDQVRIAAHPLRIKEPSVLLIAPLLYFYVRRRVGPGRPRSAVDILHLVPFFLFFAINLPFFIHGRDSVYTRFFVENQLSIGLVIWALMVAQFGFYLRAIARLISAHLHTAREELSNTEDVDFSWIRFFMAVFLVLYAAVFSIAAILVHIGDFPSYGKAAALVYAVSVFVLGYKALFQKDIFATPREPRRQDEPPADDLAYGRPGERGAAQSPGPSSVRRPESPLARHVIGYVEKEKCYLDPDLTLTELARSTGIGRNQLSEIINTELAGNFYDFINKYRVEEVKRLLADPAKRSVKIIAVAFEAGFPSKSTFNSIFKKWTGLTPSEYRDGLP